jgi:hypothetical protein
MDKIWIQVELIEPQSGWSSEGYDELIHSVIDAAYHVPGVASVVKVRCDEPAVDHRTRRPNERDVR